MPFASHDGPQDCAMECMHYGLCLLFPTDLLHALLQGQACSTFKATQAQVHGSALRRIT